MFEGLREGPCGWNVVGKENVRDREGRQPGLGHVPARALAKGMVDTTSIRRWSWVASGSGFQGIP